MRHDFFLGLISLIISSVAMANPFDNFIGEYKVSSQPQVAKNAKWCNRFNFKEMVGLKVEANSKGYEQSHMLYILNPQGWSGHPTMNYSYTNEFKSGGSYATTTGSTNSAIDEWGTWGTNPPEKETLTVKLEKTGEDYTFSMIEALTINNVLTSSCSYQVKLVKK